MPILKLQSGGKDQAWACWDINEPEEELAYIAQQTCPDEIVFPNKRLEWLAGRALIRQLAEHCGLEYQGLRKDEFGKPFLKTHPHQISLSHSFPYVAAQIDRLQSVGIDLEEPKEKLLKISKRVFSPAEAEDAGENLVKLCIYWCAKEALYKIHGKRNVLFSDHLTIQPFVLGESGELTCAITFPEKSIPINLAYIVKSEFVLVYTQF
ncbi:MAG TPA: 4'-phosphopantetheinyl transferase superfamily protein [Cyclobacteriaceae bacterium]|nr:4'-phosphopantetheinyl transferase superfamily protein [Cyclobacteriaceae bacterium]